MAALLALLSALAYGVSDFAAGVASRRSSAATVAGVAEVLGLLTAVIAVVVDPGVGPRAQALAWGAISGLGSALGTLSLYHGLTVGRMSVVATVSALLTAVIPVIVGIALGNRIAVTAAVGILLVVPALVLVCSRPGGAPAPGAGRSLTFGVLSGAGFALLFIALDRAGTRSGAWPLVPGQVVSLIPIAPLAYRDLRRRGRPPRRAAAITVGAGILSGAANLLFLAATGHGELAIVAVLSALYPAVTVILARVVLAEHWTRRQAIGLIAAAGAIVLVSV
jgi:uncharacterized membrane protein